MVSIGADYIRQQGAVLISVSMVLSQQWACVWRRGR